MALWVFVQELQGNLEALLGLALLEVLHNILLDLYCNTLMSLEERRRLVTFENNAVKFTLIETQFRKNTEKKKYTFISLMNWCAEKEYLKPIKTE